MQQSLFAVCSQRGALEAVNININHRKFIHTHMLCNRLCLLCNSLCLLCAVREVFSKRLTSTSSIENLFTHICCATVFVYCATVFVCYATVFVCCATVFACCATVFVCCATVFVCVRSQRFLIGPCLTAHREGLIIDRRRTGEADSRTRR